MSCVPRLERLLPGGYILHGACGERVELAKLVITAEDLPPTACADFREAALRTFGRRAVPREESEMPFELRRAVGAEHDLEIASWLDQASGR